MWSLFILPRSVLKVAAFIDRFYFYLHFTQGSDMFFGCILYILTFLFNWVNFLPPLPPVSDPSNTSDDGAFDIITEEEVNGVYDSDNTSQTTGGSLEGEQDRRNPGALDMWVYFYRSLGLHLRHGSAGWFLSHVPEIKYMLTFIKLYHMSVSAGILYTLHPTLCYSFTNLVSFACRSSL